MTAEPNTARGISTDSVDYWEGDMLGRKDDAHDLIAYIESVAGRPAGLREDKQSYTIAVDAPAVSVSI